MGSIVSRGEDFVRLRGCLPRWRSTENVAEATAVSAVHVDELKVVGKLRVPVVRTRPHRGKTSRIMMEIVVNARHGRSIPQMPLVSL